MKKFLSAYNDYGIGRFFIPFGIIALVFGMFFFIHMDKTKNYKKTEAIVTRIELVEEEYDDGDTHHDAQYDVYVKYTVNGREYNEYYGLFSDLEEGETTTIAYDPNDPSVIAQPIGLIVPVALCAAGTASLAFGIISTVNTFKKRKALKEQEESWKK